MLKPEKKDNPLEQIYIEVALAGGFLFALVTSITCIFIIIKTLFF